MDITQEVKTGVLYMVDLAGSERAAVTKVTSTTVHIDAFLLCELEQSTPLLLMPLFQ